MKSNAWWVIWSLFAGAGLAQSPQNQMIFRDGGISQRLISIFIPNTPHAPFSAIVNTEWVRTLPDNTRITLVNHRLIARDTAGRIFQERRLLVPQNGKQESVVTQIEIRDPILKQQTICIPKENTCQVEFQEPIANAVRSLASGERPEGMKAAGIQDLGTRIIGGVETVGTRETITIPAGAIGNDSVIHTSREYWFSSQLGLNLVSVREDPRFGSQRFELSDVALGEPDAKLFSPAEGSRMVDLSKATDTKTTQERK